VARSAGSAAAKAVVGSGKEQGNAPAEIGDAISEAVGRALDTKPVQLVGYCALRDRRQIAA
jgi:hypothetical protein